MLNLFVLRVDHEHAAAREAGMKETAVCGDGNEHHVVREIRTRRIGHRFVGLLPDRGKEFLATLQPHGCTDGRDALTNLFQTAVAAGEDVPDPASGNRIAHAIRTQTAEIQIRVALMNRFQAPGAGEIVRVA